MELITSKFENNTLFIVPHGRIDSANAAQAETLITNIINQFTTENVVIDAEDLQYISSAGLRIVLRIRKLKPQLKVINASPEIFEIFEMTGFTEMMPIEKAYRKLSIEGCEVIGQGANGKVYRLDSDTIIKVYSNPDSLSDIHRERELARRAFVLGIPTAIPYDVVKVDDKYGSVFELLNAKSFAKILASEPEKLDEIVKMYVELLQKIHSTEVMPNDMPDMKDIVLDWVEYLKDYLPENKWEKLYSLISAVPQMHNMIHGDYHAKNVMLQNGEVLLIDMDTLAQGAPVFEFASVFNAYIGFSALDHSVSQSFLGIPHDISCKVWQKTLELYFNTSDKAFLQSLEDKFALIGYTRLMRRSIRRNALDTEKGKETVNYYKTQIENLLDRIDTLQI